MPLLLSPLLDQNDTRTISTLPGANARNEKQQVHEEIQSIRGRRKGGTKETDLWFWFSIKMERAGN